MEKSHITHEEILNVFEYDEKIGHLIWKNPVQKQYKGKLARY
jgi:hypothetical protein